MNLWTVAAVNPKRRRRSAKARANPKRRRSAAQRAATARMLAANRARSGGAKRRTSRRRASVSVASVTRRARSVVRSVRRRARSAGGMSTKGLGGTALQMIKNGAIGAGGAISVDLAMGFVGPMLPASFATKLNADGSNNYSYFAAKAAVALGVGILGAKVVRPDVARQLAAGSFTVMAYELLRPMAANLLPASMSLGWMSPGRIVGQNMPTGGMGKLGVYDQSLGRVNGLRAYNNVSSIASPNNPGTIGRGAATARRMG